MIRNRKAGLVLLAVLWSPIGLLADEWYENYERALEHIQRQEWQTALDYLNEAVDAKPEPKQNAKTYGLRFIDYFPYLYRGVAQWELGNYDLAGKNLTKSETLGEVLKASKDKDAPSLLRTYLGLVEKRKVQEREKVVKSMFDEAKGLYQQEKFEAAKEKFNELLGFEPSHPGASQYLTQIEDQLNPKQPAVAKTDKSDRVNKEFTAGLELYLSANSPPPRKSSRMC